MMAIARRLAARGHTALALPFTAVILLLFAAELRADHIPSAHEALGPTWWGLMLLGLAGLAFMGGISLAVWKLVRAEDGRYDGPPD